MVIKLLLKKLKKEFPQCEVRKLDPNDIQGSPDLLLICPLTWATLETKGYKKCKQTSQSTILCEQT